MNEALFTVKNKVNSNTLTLNIQSGVLSNANCVSSSPLTDQKITLCKTKFTKGAKVCLTG